MRDEADVLLLAGDLTNYGQPDEMEPLLNVVVRSRIPTIAVLGNHDYESNRQVELMKMMNAPALRFSTVRLTSEMGLGSPAPRALSEALGAGC